MRVVTVMADLLLRQGLLAVLAAGPVVEVVAEATDLPGGRRALRATSPDLLVVGDRLPPLGVGGALLLLAEARAAGVRTIVVSDAVDEELTASVIDDDARGWGWLVRSEVLDADQLLATVARVARGGTVISDTVVRRLAGRDAGRVT